MMSDEIGWNPEKLFKFIDGFGQSIRGKPGNKMVPVGHLKRYIMESFNYTGDTHGQEEETPKLQPSESADADHIGEPRLHGGAG